MNILERKRVFGIIILILVIFVQIVLVPIVGAHPGTRYENLDFKKVTLILDQKGGFLIVPSDDVKITDLSTTDTTKKSATAYLSGTIDTNNFVVLEGVIILDGEEEKVQLSGEATQVFIGWDVPEGAKPIYSKVGNMTITRYEGATEMYATYVNLQDKEGKYKLHGEFYIDGKGGVVGKVMRNGVECEIGLLGSSVSMYENVSRTATPVESAQVLASEEEKKEESNTESSSSKNESSQISSTPGFGLLGSLICLYGGWKFRKK